MKLFLLPDAGLSPLLISASVAIALLLAAPTAQAVPALQVYIDGATYDNAEESWKITSPSNEPLRLWVVGNVAGPGGKGPLTDVRAAFAYSSGAGNVTLNITPTTTGGTGGVTDPVRADGKKLSKHGVYGNGIDWQEGALGDMTLTDSPIADFMSAFPHAPLEASGQINAYDISVAGLNEGEWIHVDLYGAYFDNRGRVKSVFAPFSHDAEFAILSVTSTSGETPVPEPAAALILAPFLAFLMYRRHRQTATAL